MNVRTRPRFHRDPTPHTAWCAGDHRCNLAEHRSDEIVIDLPGHGRAVLTRIRDGQGREYGEIRARIALAPAEPCARHQLHDALTDLRALITRAARTAYRRTAA
jgi:hypothetical protein